ncbi:uncharacterized protein LOC125939818 [Dermacentor silvarum]|uniref:uncharacterized protein LOC125939818 n=1 Tax=Dermacentor silvarum TaxID=543639 RepID=UPI002101ABBB|nr:uncharacterized protein LOC125939818 [Dermacentor silvarum]
MRLLSKRVVVLSEGYLNKDFIHTGSVSTIPGYVWALTLEVHSGQKLLSVHLTFENASPTLPISEYWGTKSYLSTNHWVPTGTIGVFECVLADPSKENSMSLLNESNKEKKTMKFSTSSLPVNSVLYYNIRLSPTAYIVSTSFDDTSETVYENARGGAHFIKANFSDAVYVRRYDMSAGGALTVPIQCAGVLACGAARALALRRDTYHCGLERHGRHVGDKLRWFLPAPLAGGHADCSTARSREQLSGGTAGMGTKADGQPPE